MLEKQVPIGVLQKYWGGRETGHNQMETTPIINYR